MVVERGDGWELRLGDCRAVLPALDAESVDSIVTDPPYELGFMGKKWDASGVAFSIDLWREVLRVLKPGGHLLAFSGTRTYHRMVCAIEDAGFEIRDQLAWMYGSGFPKSLDVSKAIDATVAYSPEAAAWSGWGTALKPAQEPIVLARKPLIGTVAANVLTHGTGGINIDGCRVGLEGMQTHWANYAPSAKIGFGGGEGERTGPAYNPAGRWPANVLFDEAAAEALDAQTGTDMRPGERPAKRGSTMGYHGGDKGTTGERVVLPTGGASRFFYVAKASRSEREAGLRHLAKRTAGELTDREDGSAGLRSPRAGAGRTSSGRANHHPTVKPDDVMRWLARLITPPGGLVLDPFLGSGTTGIACLLEDFRFVGVELDPAYLEIAAARLRRREHEIRAGAHPSQQNGLFP